MTRTKFGFIEPILGNTDTQKTVSCKGFKFPSVSDGQVDERYFYDPSEINALENKGSTYLARSLVNEATKGGQLEPLSVLDFYHGNEKISKNTVRPCTDFSYGVQLKLECEIVSGKDMYFTSLELYNEPAIVDYKYLKYTLTYSLEGFGIKASASNFALFNDDMPYPIFNSLRGHFLDSDIIDREYRDKCMTELPSDNGSYSEADIRVAGHLGRAKNVLQNNIWYKRGEHRFYPIIDKYLPETIAMVNVGLMNNGNIDTYGNNFAILNGSDEYIGALKHLNIRAKDDYGLPHDYSNKVKREFGDWDGFFECVQEDFGEHSAQFYTLSLDSPGVEDEYMYEYPGKVGYLQNYLIYNLHAECATRSTQLLLKVEDYLMKKFTS